MARKKQRKAEVNVTGLSINEILQKDAEWMLNLSKKDLAKITGRLVSAGNKRLRRIEELNLPSQSINPAYNMVMESGGYFSTKGKNLNQLRSEFARITNFMSLKTATKRGAKKYNEEVLSILNTDNMSKEQIKQAFDLLHRLKEVDPAFMSAKEKYEIMMESISMKIINNEEPEEALSDLMDKMTSIYEQEQSLNDNIGFKKM